MSRWQVPERFKIVVGGNTYINTPNIITYRGESIFELQRSDRDGYLGISFDLFGESGERLGTIRNGQFVETPPEGYSLQEEHDHFSLTEDATDRGVCDLRLREKVPGDVEIEVAARMYMPSGFLLELNPSGSNIGGALISGSTFENCGTAISVE
jgi:hypothetical protein